MIRFFLILLLVAVQPFKYSWGGAPNGTCSAGLDVFACGEGSLILPKHQLDSYMEEYERNRSAEGVTEPPAIEFSNQLLDPLVLGKTVKESGEMALFLETAMRYGLSEEQKAIRWRFAGYKTAISLVGSVAFYGSIVLTTYAFLNLVGEIADTNEGVNLIRSIEGLSKAYGASEIIRIYNQLNEEAVTVRELEFDEDFGTSRGVYLNLSSGERRKIPKDILEGLSREDLVLSEDKSTLRVTRHGHTDSFPAVNIVKYAHLASMKGNIPRVLFFIATQAIREGLEVGVRASASLITFASDPDAFSEKLKSVMFSVFVGSAPLASYLLYKGFDHCVLDKEGCCHCRCSCGKPACCQKSRFQTSDLYKGVRNAALIVFMTALAQYAVHEIEEWQGIDVKMYDWTGGDKSSLWSEKNLPWALFSACIPYDANASFWQLMTMIGGYCWAAKEFFLPIIKLTWRRIKRCKPASATESFSP